MAIKPLKYYTDGKDVFLNGALPGQKAKLICTATSNRLAQKIASNMTKPLTDRELLVAGFAYRCAEKGDNIQQMEYLLREMFERTGGLPCRGLRDERDRRG